MDRRCDASRRSTPGAESGLEQAAGPSTTEPPALTSQFTRSMPRRPPRTCRPSSRERLPRALSTRTKSPFSPGGPRRSRRRWLTVPIEPRPYCPMRARTLLGGLRCSWRSRPPDSPTRSPRCTDLSSRTPPRTDPAPMIRYSPPPVRKCRTRSRSTGWSATHCSRCSRNDRPDGWGHSEP